MNKNLRNYPPQPPQPPRTDFAVQAADITHARFQRALNLLCRRHELLALGLVIAQQVGSGVEVALSRRQLFGCGGELGACLVQLSLQQER